MSNPLMGLLQLRYEHDSSTIRLRFGYNTLRGFSFARIRDFCLSRGLGDVYKRQKLTHVGPGYYTWIGDRFWRVYRLGM